MQAGTEQVRFTPPGGKADARELAETRVGAGEAATASRTVSLAYSPCPNDTFTFHRLTSGRVTVPGIAFKTSLYDVETLNRKALRQEFDVSKVSFHAYLKVRDHYRLLNSGAALGFGCGPLVVATKELDPDTVSRGTILVPGELTTGYLLLRLWMPSARNIRFVPYDRILPLLQEGAAQAGVIIHESRFVYKQAGLCSIMDLGRWWEEKTGYPIPLGGIVTHRRLGDDLSNAIDDAIRASILQARHAPAETMPYVRQFAQETSDAVIAQHIRTFVNDFSVDMGEAGRRAVARLEAMAVESGALS